MKLISFFLFLLCLCSSCDSYFNEELHQHIPDKEAFHTLKDITNALNGIYYTFGSAAFQGCNVPALGDLAADNATADPSSGHWVALSTYTYTEHTKELEEIWTAGYSMIDAGTRLIQGTHQLLAERPFNTSDSLILQSTLAQAYALRAHAAFVLVNLFGLPAGTDDSPHGGLVIVEDHPAEPGDRLSRSSVAATYQWILRDITKAHSLPNVISGTPQFYYNPAAVKALEARVNLYLKNYSAAGEAATRAISLRNSVPADSVSYLTMWNSTEISPEDIFTIAKSTTDNLSSNSLNTLYSSYGSKLTGSLTALFGPADLRLSLIDPASNQPAKYRGLPEAATVSNIPVFRISEMYLILAEAKATTHPSEAREALFFTARRNKAISHVSVLPSTPGELLEFIKDERRRELFAEGHRWFDARRNGEKINLNNGSIPNYDVSRLVFPIPAAEINSGSGVGQNPDWPPKIE